MFCEKCGTKNNDGSKFCEGCGAPLNFEQENVVFQNDMTETKKEEFVAPKLNEDNDVVFESNMVSAGPKQPMTKKNKMIILSGAIAVILLGLLFYAGKVLTDPGKTVDKYMQSISEKNYTEAYKYMNIESTEFTTKDMYEKVMNNKNSKDGAKDILNYSIAENFNMNPHALTRRYTVKYTEKGSSDTSEMYITLVKQPSKKWLFYDDYKIAEDGLIAKDFSIVIPKGTQLYIDGIKVEDKYIEPDTDKTTLVTRYNIPSIFIGTHNVKITSPFSKDEEFEYEVFEYGSIDIASVKMNDTAKQELSETAEEFVEKYVTGAIGGKNVEELKPYLSANIDMDNFHDSYEELSDKGVGKDGTGVKNVTLSKFKSTPDKEFHVGSYYTVVVEYDYTYTSLREDWYDDEIEQYTPDRPERGNINVNFIYEDGKWKVFGCYVNMYFYN